MIIFYETTEEIEFWNSLVRQINKGLRTKLAMAIFSAEYKSECYETKLNNKEIYRNFIKNI
ncbi:hypothetical protein [Niallia nealsonii]|uniref:Uncharacterized protein n=1 Tax=Niallia nealsonii TaxID=115979 RepID=A0A2N0Z353_9BACI|nr:hypothetical protein [Niallia nealsonii]PKG23937.1 hypothetical protein CWS01_09200 [Niallia nealsonii]